MVNQKTSLTFQKGFTLIEVLLALSVIAIAITALIKTTHELLVTSMRLEENTLGMIVADQGLIMIKLGLIKMQVNTVDPTFNTKLLNKTWYWRVHQEHAPSSFFIKRKISVSPRDQSHFIPMLQTFEYTS